MKAPEHVTELLEPVIEGLGYECVGVEFHPSRGEAVLRVFIDGPNGVNVDDCARVSHQVSGVLDVEDPITGDYALEVSSPGLDRPVFKTSDYTRFTGESVRIRLRERIDGRRKISGRLAGLTDEGVIVETGEGRTVVPLSSIDGAHIELEP